MRKENNNNNLWRETFARFVVDALVKLATKQLDAQDGKDQPEDEADEQHVENGRNGEHERVDDNLKRNIHTSKSSSRKKIDSPLPSFPAIEKWPGAASELSTSSAI